MEKLEQEIKDLKYQNDILKKNLDNVYKYWLFDANKYTDLKSKYNNLKKEYLMLIELSSGLLGILNDDSPIKESALKMDESPLINDEPVIKDDKIDLDKINKIKNILYDI